jgi:hypothetical protein
MVGNIQLDHLLAIGLDCSNVDYETLQPNY